MGKEIGVWSKLSNRPGQEVFAKHNPLNGEIYFYARFIERSPAGEQFLARITSPSISKIQLAGDLVDFEVVDSPADSPVDASVMIKIQPVYFPLGPSIKENVLATSHLSFYSLRSSALAWLRINKALANDGLALVDSHLANFAFDKSMRPIWIDVGSIVPIEHGAEGLIEFRRDLARRLTAMRIAPALSEMIRAYPRISASGLSSISKIPSLSYRGIELSSGLLIFLNRKYGLVMGKNVRRATLFLAFLLVPQSKLGPKNYWTHYIRKDALDASPNNSREEVFVNVLRKLRYSSVLDLGGNDGRFLWLATNQGKIDGALVDTEDRAVSFFLHRLSVKRGSDFNLEAAPISGQVVGANEVKNKFELVIALALVDHLVLSQQWSLERVSGKLGSLSSKYVLVEWMPKGVGVLQSTYSKLPEWYTLEKFLEALGKNFAAVEVIEETRGSHRILVLCIKDGSVE